MALDIELDPQEARVLGVLIEKSLTTPDQYPLTLNALTNGCNQKSNRDPVLSLSESEVHSAVSRLLLHHLSGAVHPAGSRVEKFRHNAQELLELDKAEVAILAELLNRGPQTPGELRTRVKRMASVESQEFLQRLLDKLIERELLQHVAPATGSRAARYGQCLAPTAHAQTPAASPVASTEASPGAHSPQSGPSLGARVETLEVEVEELKSKLSALADQLGASL